MYNIEKRAEKVISKDKPTRAPMHPSAAKELESLREGKSMKFYSFWDASMFLCFISLHRYD